MDFNKRMNWFDNDTLAKDWLNSQASNIMFQATAHQEDWIYMAGELGEGRNPMLKDNFLEVFETFIAEKFSYIQEVMLMAMLQYFYEQNIDVPIDIANKFNEYFEYPVEDEEFMIGRTKYE